MEKENMQAGLSLVKHHNFDVIGLDTDSIIIKKKDGSGFSEEERRALLDDINARTGEFIEWADDDYFPVILYIKTKNYILLDEDGNQKTKGSALKATTKEKALKQFIQDVIGLLLKDRTEDIMDLYFNYARQILKLKDMSEWSTKHTITKAVLEGKGTAQVRIREAIKGVHVQEGDKVFLFFKSPTERCMVEDFDGTYDASILLGKLYDTLRIFETVLDIKQYPNLTLKKNKGVLDALL